jgi:teichuronic acid biosynthesis glycosyltransferase TuaH
MQFIYSLFPFIKPLVPRKILNFYREFRKINWLIDHSEVVLYASSSFMPDYQPRKNPLGLESRLHQRVTLISTVLNEASNAYAWLNSLLEQSRLPDEVVITDGGSQDGTLSLLREIALTFPIPLRVIEAPGSNISQGRNQAIKAATHPLIACTDFGCQLAPEWLEKLVLPFEDDEQIQLSAGFYQVHEESRLARIASQLFLPKKADLNPQDFLPSSRSLAMKKSFWEKAGTYPEWLTDAGEDTLFDYQTKFQFSRWAYVPQAIVYWHPPYTFWKLLRTIYRYSQGDGETGVMALRYWYIAIRAVGLVLLMGLILATLVVTSLFNLLWALEMVSALFFVWLLMLIYSKWRGNSREAKLTFPFASISDLAVIIQTLGYLKGVASRPAVETRKITLYHQRLQCILERHPNRQGVIVYPPTHDWGFMFQRPHQMARALARQGYLYFFCTPNERNDTVIGFQEIEPFLYLAHIPMESFLSLEAPLVYVGSPWNLEMLRYFEHPVVIYDHYDDIEVASAREEDHLTLLAQADLVLVSSQLLLEKAQQHRTNLLLMPNAADYPYIQRFLPAPGEQMPPEWESLQESGSPVIGYSGALAEWFDYDLLSYLAVNRPDWTFALLGTDYDGSLSKRGVLDLPNIHWLGVRSYNDLFRYLWRFDVGIIPFKVNKITLATSPIKLFEYMACNLPVVSTALPECRNYQGILIAETHQDFLERLEEALQCRQNPAYLALIQKVAQSNTWDIRALSIIQALPQPEKNTQGIGSGSL